MTLVTHPLVAHSTEIEQARSIEGYTPDHDDQMDSDDVPSRESAIAKVLNLYAPEPGCELPYQERRRQALAAVVRQVANGGRGLQESYMRALRVDQLLAEGKITEPRPRLTQEEGGPTNASASALSLYIERVKADSRLTARLLRRADDTVAPTAGQSFDEYLGALIRADFDKGFDACDYPQLHAEVTAQAEQLAQEARDEYAQASEGQVLVDEAWENDRRTRLISQALEIAYQAEERFLGLGDAPVPQSHKISTDTVPSADDSINPFVLAMNLGEADRDDPNDQNGSDDGYPRPRA